MLGGGRGVFSPLAPPSFPGGEGLRLGKEEGRRRRRKEKKKSWEKVTRRGRGRREEGRGG